MPETQLKSQLEKLPKAVRFEIFKGLAESDLKGLRSVNKQLNREVLENLKLSKRLDLSKFSINQVRLIIPNLLTTHPDLKEIIGHPGLKNRDLFWFSKLNNITHLDLSKCNNLTYASLKYLKELKSLEYLDLNQCSISNSSLKNIKELPLKYLNLGYCDKLTDSALEYLKNMPLQFLKIAECGILKGSGLKYLNKSTLKYLNLDGGRLLRDNELIKSFKGLYLQYLGLNRCSNLTGDVLCGLGEMFLQYLDLGYCYELTDDKLFYLQKLPLLHLDLSSCTLLTDNGIGYLKELNLEVLYLSGCKRLTNQSLHDLRELPLQDLDISCCNFTNGILPILQELPLKSLNLVGCRQLSCRQLNNQNELDFLKIEYIRIPNGTIINSSSNRPSPSPQNPECFKFFMNISRDVAV